MSGSPGTVHLVGAGPGDPGLISVRAVERLKAADVVVYEITSACTASTSAGTRAGRAST